MLKVIPLVKRVEQQGYWFIVPGIIFLMIIVSIGYRSFKLSSFSLSMAMSNHNYINGSFILFDILVLGICWIIGIGSDIVWLYFIHPSQLYLSSQDPATFQTILFLIGLVIISIIFIGNGFLFIGFSFTFSSSSSSSSQSSMMMAMITNLKINIQRMIGMILFAPFGFMNPIQGYEMMEDYIFGLVISKEILLMVIRLIIFYSYPLIPFENVLSLTISLVIMIGFISHRIISFIQSKKQLKSFNIEGRNSL